MPYVLWPSPQLVISLSLIFALVRTVASHLNQDIQPTHYDLTLTLDPEKDTFEGDLYIDLRVPAGCNSISLHALDLKVQSANFVKENVAPINFSAKQIIIDKEIVKLTFKEVLDAKKKYSLRLRYTGAYSDWSTGIYKSNYFGSDERIRWMLSTQLEPVSARRVFPCFDEPKYKTTYTLNVLFPQKMYDVVSNCVQRETKWRSDLNLLHNIWDCPSMPTYLLSLIVFDNNMFKNTFSADFLFNIYAHKNNEKVQTMTQEATQLTTEFLKYSGLADVKLASTASQTSFTTSKIQILFGGRNPVMFAKDVTETEDRRDVVMNMSYILAQNAFTSLDSTEWWDFSWPNKAFTIFLQYKVLEKVYPKWKFDEKFVVDVLQTSFQQDGRIKHATREKPEYISSENNIRLMSDLNYKGSSIIRMMEHCMTPNAFRNGIKAYLQSLQQSGQTSTTGTISGLYKAMSGAHVEQFEFETFWTSWTKNEGYPLVTVERDYKLNSATITQEQFTEDFKKKETVPWYSFGNSWSVAVSSKPVTSRTLWYIPLTCIESGNARNQDVRYWMKHQSLSINIGKPNSWVIFNTEKKGYYRVNYDEKNWEYLIEQLHEDHSQISVINRAQLVDDSYNLAKTGRIEFNVFYRVVSYLSEETEYAPWVPAIRALEELMIHFQRNGKYLIYLRGFLIDLLTVPIETVGLEEIENENDAVKLTRILIMNFAAKIEHKTLINHSRVLIGDLADRGTTRYSADVQKILLCLGIRKTSRDVWRKIFSQMEKWKRSSKTLLNDYVMALGCAEDVESIYDYINFFATKQNPYLTNEEKDKVYEIIMSSEDAVKNLFRMINEMNLTGTLTDSHLKIIKRMLKKIDKHTCRSAVVENIINAMATFEKRTELDLENSMKSMKKGMEESRILDPHISVYFDFSSSNIVMDAICYTIPFMQRFRTTSIRFKLKNKTGKRLKKLRNLFDDTTYVPKPIDAYIIPHDDAHLNEFIAPRDDRLKFISRFTGSAGTVVVTKTAAALWTDSRYFIQASHELDDTWTLMKEGLPETPTIVQWLLKTLPRNSIVGFDPRLYAHQEWVANDKRLSPKLSLVPVEQNLIDVLWDNRPPPSNAPIIPLPMKYSGKSCKDKVDEVRKLMTTEEECTAYLVSILDEVAWLLNLRGSDIDYNPIFFSYVILTKDKVHLFIDLKKKSEDVVNHFRNENLDVTFHSYDSIIKFIKDHLVPATRSLNGKILTTYDYSYAIMMSIPTELRKVVSAPIISVLKYTKNETEIKGMANSHARDSAALITYFAWLENEINIGHYVSEVTGAVKLLEFRQEIEDFVGLSFHTISSFGSNAAIIHYESTMATDRQITKENLYLCDSGGQYRDGTTDVTRTMHFGTPTDYQKECFTYVFKGQTNLAMAVFDDKIKEDTVSFDKIARRFLKNAGKSYGHGTSHGVGAYLSVHEGNPLGFPYEYSKNNPGLGVGMFMSNEPGYYEEGNFGIRLENVMGVAPVKDANSNSSNQNKKVTFDTITLVPIQKKMLDLENLTPQEKQYLNDYHKQILEKIGPMLRKAGKQQAADWLTKETEPIK